MLYGVPAVGRVGAYGHQAFQIIVPRLLAIFLVFVWGFCGIWGGFVWHFCGICVGFVIDFCGIVGGFGGDLFLIFGGFGGDCASHGCPGGSYGYPNRHLVISNRPPPFDACKRGGDPLRNY